jgi:hypothetical protein
MQHAVVVQKQDHRLFLRGYWLTSAGRLASSSSGAGMSNQAASRGARSVQVLGSQVLLLDEQVQVLLELLKVTPRSDSDSLDNRKELGC